MRTWYGSCMLLFLLTNSGCTHQDQDSLTVNSSTVPASSSLNDDGFERRWAEARSSQERLELVVSALEERLIVHGSDYFEVVELFGGELSDWNLEEDRGYGIAFMTPEADRQRVGWEVGRWYLYVEFDRLQSPGAVKEKRTVRKFYLTNWDPKVVS